MSSNSLRSSFILFINRVSHISWKKNCDEYVVIDMWKCANSFVDWTNNQICITQPFPILQRIPWKIFWKKKNNTQKNENVRGAMRIDKSANNDALEKFQENWHNEKKYIRRVEKYYFVTILLWTEYDWWADEHFFVAFIHLFVCFIS